MKRNLFTIFGLIVLANILSFALTPALVQADLKSDIDQELAPIQTIYGQGQVDRGTLSATIAEVIKIVLSFLGVIFIILIIYAGFMWMTSAGNEEKITKAKKTMVAAVIGVAIILLAYAITTFVMESLMSATGTRGAE